MFAHFFFILFPVATSDEIHIGTKLTRYSCDGAKLQLLCPPYSIILIIRANYGRFSISVCNEEAMTTMRTDCGNPVKTSEIIRNLCENKAVCTIEVEEDIFASVDCPDTSKYLEVQYHCKQMSSGTRLPNLEGNITSLWNYQDKILSSQDLNDALESAKMKVNIKTLHKGRELESIDIREDKEMKIPSDENLVISDATFPRTRKENGLGHHHTSVHIGSVTMQTMHLNTSSNDQRNGFKNLKNHQSAIQPEISGAAIIMIIISATMIIALSILSAILVKVRNIYFIFQLYCLKYYQNLLIFS